MNQLNGAGFGAERMRYKAGNRPADAPLHRSTQINTGAESMRRSLLVLILALLPLAATAQNSPLGRWKTVDDETGRVKSIVEVSEAADGSLQGTVVEILHSERGPDPVCDKCSGANKDKPIQGMTILWGLRRDGEGWAGGTILDPAKGRSYRSKAELLDGGRKLGVSGCITFICRQQVWVRE